MIEIFCNFILEGKPPFVSYLMLTEEKSFPRWLKLVIQYLVPVKRVLRDRGSAERYFSLTHILFHILATSYFSVSRSSDIGRNGLVRDPVRVQGR